MSITIDFDQYDGDGILLFESDKITFNPGITILVGCNGSGKTTLMNQIRNKYEYIESRIVANLFTCCDTSREMDRLMFYGSQDRAVNRVATMLCSSEGERIAIGLVSAFDWMWNQCRNKDIDDIFVLLDSLDSGLDIFTMKSILDTILEAINIAKDDFNKNLYFVLSTNSYALVENNKCLDVRTGSYVEFKNWNEYLEFINRSHEIKENRYNEAIEKERDSGLCDDYRDK